MGAVLLLLLLHSVCKLHLVWAHVSDGDELGGNSGGGDGTHTAVPHVWGGDHGTSILL